MRHSSKSGHKVMCSYLHSNAIMIDLLHYIQVYIARKPNPRGQILVTHQLFEPNPKCYVCAEKREVSVRLNLEKTTLRTLEERILKVDLAMVAPDAEIEGQGVVLISSEDDGESDVTTKDKLLKDFGLKDGSILSCDDFLQDYNVKVILYQW